MPPPSAMHANLKERAPADIRNLAAQPQPSLSPPAATVMDLQGTAGNQAVTSVIQRSPDGNAGSAEIPHLETGVGWLDRMLFSKDLAQNAGASGGLAQMGKTLAPSGAVPPTASGQYGQGLGQAGKGIFGGLQLGLGLKNLVTGIGEGGKEGASQAVSGGADVISGGASLLHLGGVNAAGPIGMAATSFALGHALGNAGLEESPYDLPGTAASWGHWMDEKAGGGALGTAAGLLGTAAGSIAMTPAAAYYGAKRAGKWLTSPLDLPWNREESLPAPTLTFENHEHIDTGPITQTAKEVTPQFDPWYGENKVSSTGELIEDKPLTKREECARNRAFNKMMNKFLKQNMRASR